MLIPLQLNLKHCEHSRHGEPCQSPTERTSQVLDVLLTSFFFFWNSTLHWKFYIFCLFLRTQKRNCHKACFEAWWKFHLSNREMCKNQNVLINTTVASCWPDKQAREQSRFKYQWCLICPSKWRNKTTLPNYQHYKNTALLQIKHKGSSPSSEPLRESASYFWAPLPVSSVSSLPDLESFRAGNQTPCLDSHHPHLFMSASRASWPPASAYRAHLNKTNMKVRSPVAPCLPS